MKSPPSTEVMGIDMLVNANGNAAASSYPQQAISSMPSPDQTPLSHGPRSMADPLERTGSPHGSIPSVHSRYSTPRPGDIPETLPRSYPSPTPMLQSSEPQLPAMAVHGMPPTSAPQQYQPGYRPPVVPGNWNQTIQPMPSQQAVPSRGPVKAFPCSTCRKGFARRSDLARHGKMQPGLYAREESSDLPSRENPQRTQAARLRLSRLRQAVHPAVCAHCALPRAYRREAAHVRAVWKSTPPPGS